ncbi:hypothetical protein MUK42_00624 [Musa troglodytarum]|uniref:BHLH domain-containing protein n=1 Tax=Musa troglodytarum TaxID=320322 RepID=A0A9E7FCS9_9LILI|nr:hypothetical protein MUK42_00624 [Musa troglodytarum]
MVRTLKGIVPAGGDRMDPPPVLDEAVKYLKSLQVEAKQLGMKHHRSWVSVMLQCLMAQRMHSVRACDAGSSAVEDEQLFFLMRWWAKRSRCVWNCTMYCKMWDPCFSWPSHPFVISTHYSVEMMETLQAQMSALGISSCHRFQDFARGNVSLNPNPCAIKTWSFLRDERVQAACTIGDLKLRRHKRSSGFG